MNIELLKIINKYYYDCDDILALIFIILDTSQILMIP